MNDLVSVIIPVYNVEKYLQRCIESVIKQTYKNIEIILVDDGSPDNCGKICDSYAEKDSRIIVIHKNNEGVSAARNDGITISKGDYICFVDSDDYVLENYVEVLYKTIIEKKVDLASCSSFRCVNDILYKNYQYRDLILYNSSQEFYDMLCVDFRAFPPWSKIYKSSIIKDNQVVFPRGIQIGEDVLFNISYAKHAKSSAYISEALYIYVDSESSVTNNMRNKSYYPNYTKTIEFTESLKDGGNALFLNAVRIRNMCVMLDAIYDNRRFKLNNNVDMYKTEIRNSRLFFIKYKFSLWRKFRYICILISPSFFILMTKILSVIRKLTKNR